jgi:SAM-dependent methyltransferase
MARASSPRVSTHYRGAQGATYHRHYQPLAAAFGEVNARKFQRFVGPGDTVVDFGCGPGFTLARLQSGRAIGVEVNDESRRFAESLGIETATSADLLAEESADVVISNHCLEHTLNPLEELRQLHRVLRPGGMIVLYVPVDDWRSRHQRRVDPDINHHLYAWTPLLLANLLREAGFADPDCRIENRGLPGRATALLLRALPPWLFEQMTVLVALLLKRREIRATARRSDKR